MAVLLPFPAGNELGMSFVDEEFMAEIETKTTSLAFLGSCFFTLFRNKNYINKIGFLQKSRDYNGNKGSRAKEKQNKV